MIDREMRRKKQQMKTEDAESVLKRATAGVLAVMGEDDYPYAVPVSYVYEDSKIYFHGANQGYKLEAIRKNGKVSFCVVDYDGVVPEKFTTNYRSVIVFGKARIIENQDEKNLILEKIAMRYSSEYASGIKKQIEDHIKNTSVVEIVVEHMTGKESLGLMK